MDLDPIKGNSKEVSPLKRPLPPLNQRLVKVKKTKLPIEIKSRSTVVKISFPNMSSNKSVSNIPVQREHSSSLRPFRLGTISKGLSFQGFSRQAIDLINNDHKPSTRNQYQGVWNKFLKFLKHHGIADKDIDVSIVANFLALHADLSKGPIALLLHISVLWQTHYYFIWGYLWMLEQLKN